MLCFKDNSDNIVEIKPPRAIDGGGGEVPPDTGNTEGDLVWDGTHLRVWDGNTWLAVGPGSLAYIQKADMGTVTNTAGDGFDIPLVNNLQAGLMAPGDKNKLDSYPASPDALALDLQAVTDNGNTTTNSAVFGGSVRVGSNTGDGDGDGAFISASGAVNVSRADAGVDIWRGYTSGDNTITSRIDAAGKAQFGAGNITLNADGVGDFNGGVNLYGGRLNMVRHQSTSPNPVGFSPDITAAFASGNVQAVNNAAEIQVEASGETSGYLSAVTTDNTSAIAELSHFRAKPRTDNAENNIAVAIGFNADASLSNSGKVNLAYGFTQI